MFSRLKGSPNNFCVLNKNDYKSKKNYFRVKFDVNFYENHPY